MTLAGGRPILRPVSLAIAKHGSRRWATVSSIRPRTADVVLAIGLLLFLLLVARTPAVVDPAGQYAKPVFELGGHWHDDRWAWLLQILLVVPLIWRRRAPMAVFVVISAVALVQWLAGPELYGDLAFLIALYTVVAYEPRRISVAIALAVATAALGLGTSRWVAYSDATAASVIALTGMVGLPVTIGVIVRLRRRAAVSMREAATQAERKRIAGEMHDVVSHNLTVMVALADGARLTFDRDAASAEAAMAQVAQTGRDALAEMRRLLGVVQDDPENAPLRPQPNLDDLTVLADSVRAAGLDVQLKVSLEEKPPAGLALTAYRIVQEALTNVLKHTPSATKVDVLVRQEGNSIEMNVRNDGTAISDQTDGDGRGILGMKERAALHSGTVEAGPDVTGGWLVRAHLPTGKGRP